MPELRISPAAPTRDLILTTAFGLPPSRSVVFFRSLAETSFAGKTVVFTANLGPQQRRAFELAGAEVVHHGLHLHRIFRRPLQILFWKGVRSRSDSGSFTPPWDRLQQPNILRWSLYRRYLEQNRANFDRVLMVDSRDVFFQRNPFEHFDGSRLRVFAEEGDPTVEETSWNRDSMRRAFPPEVFARLKNKRVSCSGVVLGGLEAVRRYLDDFSSFLPELNMPDHGADQCIHIRIIHEYLKDIDFPGNREGEVCHLHHVKDLLGIPTNSSGELLNARGEPFSIIHQYDRHHALAERLRNRYS